MVNIAVRGEATRLVDAETAMVRLTAEARADERAVALRECVTAQRALAEALQGLAASGRVAQWSSSRVSTRIDWVQRQFDAKADPEQVAQAAFRAEFRDLAMLGDWLAEVAEDERVRIEGVDWGVLPDTRIAVERELRLDAVAEAVRRARDYADALGAGEIEVVALFEPGLRRDSIASGFETRGRVVALSAGRGGFDLRADPIELSAEVSLDVRAHLAGPGSST